MEVGALCPMHVHVVESSQISEARRVAGGLARDLRFDETATGKVAIVVTEMATNLLKHGGGGEIFFQPVRSGAIGGLEVLAVDRGGGIADVPASLRDGHSTSGSPGTGLGAIVRLADAFDIYSVPRQGTAVFSRLWSGARAPVDVPAVTFGGTCLPHLGEEECGDGWAVEHRRGCSVLLVVDGLGHGVIAAEASREAIRLFRLNAALGPAALIEAIHIGLKHTRGAAAAVTEIDPHHGVVRFAGVGNITGVIISGSQKRHMVSYNGTIGHAVRKVAEFSYPWGGDAVLVEHSDGLGSHWDLEPYPGLQQRDPSVIAGVLSRDFRRGRDDVTVVVGRVMAP